MRKKTQYIVVNEIYKTIYCGYPQKRAWKIITGSSGGMLFLILLNAYNPFLRQFSSGDTDRFEENVNKRGRIITKYVI